MKPVNLEKLQAEAKERHKHKIRKPYTKKPKQETEKFTFGQPILRETYLHT